MPISKLSDARRATEIHPLKVNIRMGSRNDTHDSKTNRIKITHTRNKNYISRAKKKRPLWKIFLVLIDDRVTASFAS